MKLTENYSMALNVRYARPKVLTTQRLAILAYHSWLHCDRHLYSMHFTQKQPFLVKDTLDHRLEYLRIYFGTKSKHHSMKPMTKKELYLVSAKCFDVVLLSCLFRCQACQVFKEAYFESDSKRAAKLLRKGVKMIVEQMVQSILARQGFIVRFAQNDLGFVAVELETED